MQTIKAVVRNIKISVNESWEFIIALLPAAGNMCVSGVSPTFGAPEHFAACGAVIILLCYASEHRRSGTPTLSLRGPTSQKRELGRGKPHHLLEYCEEYRSGEGGGWSSRKEA